MYKNEEGGKQKEESKKLFDKYYQMDIELDHISFFATVNYPQDLVPLLKNGVDMRVLEDYTNQEKEQILRLKKEEIEQEIKKMNYGEEKDIIPEKIIEELPNYIREDGIRQAERIPGTLTLLKLIGGIVGIKYTFDFVKEINSVAVNQVKPFKDKLFTGQEQLENLTCKAGILESKKSIKKKLAELRTKKRLGIRQKEKLTRLEKLLKDEN
nr:7930_t:CDS:2 [Entrophospora candida]